MIITIDGPAAAGKSTMARALASRLQFDYLDTGSMYRAVTWKAMAQQIDLEDADAVARVAAQARITFRREGDALRVLCDGRDVSEEIRTPQVTANVYRVADRPVARAPLIEQQRRHAEGRNLVTEGRDQGTEVFPDADVKFYLDASEEVRVDRRLKDLVSLGVEAVRDEVEEQLAERDEQDRARPVGALRLSEDMIIIDSTCLTIDQVVAKMAEFVARRTGSEA